jgi:hypothetical protein
LPASLGACNSFCSAALIGLADIFCEVTGAAFGPSDDKFDNLESIIGWSSTVNGVSMDAILRRFNVARSAAENIMVASSAFINANPGGKE